MNIESLTRIGLVYPEEAVLTVLLKALERRLTDDFEIRTSVLNPSHHTRCLRGVWEIAKYDNG